MTFTQTAPFLETITNQTTVGPYPMAIPLEAPVDTNLILTATSANPSLIPNAGLTPGGVTNRTLGIVPLFGASGQATVTLAAFDNGISVTEPFTVTVSRNLFVSVPLGYVETFPILQASSGWSITGVSQGANGTVTYNAPSVTYSNNGVYTPSDSFTYQITDGISSASGTVNVTILTNVAPTAQGQSVITVQNTPVSISVFGSDAYGGAVTYILMTSPQHGSLSGSAPDFIYTPSANYSGLDSFTFEVSNRFLASAPATGSIGVRGILNETVTSTTDSGPGSLRDLLTQANADSFNIRHITLNHQSFLAQSVGDNGFGPSAFVVSNILVIDGDGPGGFIGVDPNAAPMRLFRVASNANLTLLNLTLTNGQALGGAGGDGEAGGGGGAGMGGASFNEGALIASNVILSQNQAVGGTGGIYNTF